VLNQVGGRGGIRDGGTFFTCGESAVVEGEVGKVVVVVVAVVVGVAVVVAVIVVGVVVEVVVGVEVEEIEEDEPGVLGDGSALE